MNNFFTSTNLITDLKFRQQVGVKADAFVETLAILNSKQNQDKPDLKIDTEKREELQINAKLFVKTFSTDVALSAVETLQNVLGKNYIKVSNRGVKEKYRNFLTINVRSAWYMLNPIETRVEPS